MQCPQGVRFLPAAGKRKRLRYELGVDGPTSAGFDGEVLLAGGGALLFNSVAHVRDLVLPVRGKGRERQRRLLKIRQRGGQILEILPDFQIAGDGTRASQRLNFPKLGAMPVVLLVGT